MFYPNNTNHYALQYEDCEVYEYRINNYYKQCFGPVYACKDACYDPFTNYYKPIGPWKSCGICAGIYNPSSNIKDPSPLCCVYWDGRGYHHICTAGKCPVTGPYGSVYWGSYPVTNCKYCENQNQQIYGHKVTCTCPSTGKSVTKECPTTNALCDCTDPNNPKITCL